MGEEEYESCSACGGKEIVAAVQYGSYLLRCAKCKNDLVATSWMAVGPEWPGKVKVYREGEQDAVLLEGECSEIYEDIAELAADGSVLIIDGETG